MSENKDYTIDKWTLHCVNCRINELREFNERMKEDAIDRRNETEYLIFQNRILVLVELQAEIDKLRIPTIDWRKRYGKDFPPKTSKN